MIENVISPAYRAARTGVAVADLSAWGWLLVSGRDRLDFFQRLSTNDTRGLAPGQGRPTVLTSPIGRVIALVVLYVADGEVRLRTEPGQAAPVTRYLNNLIFWNDEVQVTDRSAEAAQWGLYGPQATQALASVASGERLAELAPYGWQEVELGGTAVSVHRGGGLEVPAWTVVASRAAAAEVSAAVSALGPWLGPEALEQLRLEAGVPAWGHELSDQVTPLEVGLTPAVSFNKGCYTGQEVIARQANYDKITRVLAGLVLPAGAGPDLAGSAVRAGTGKPGFVGSVAWSPALGKPVALAIVPRDAATPGTQVSIKHGEHEIVAAVAPLPFA